MDITKGVRWLDRHAPKNWRDLIDVEELNLRDGDRCVLSQVFKEHYDEIRKKLGLTHNRAVLYGFMAAGNDYHVSAILTKAWKEYLNKPVEERQFKIGQEVYVVNMSNDTFNITGKFIIQRIDTIETQSGKTVKYSNSNASRCHAASELYASHKEAYEAWVKLHK